MYHTVIFDLDGTLLDTIADLAAAGNAVCRDNGWTEHSIEDYKAMVGHGMENLISRLSPPSARSAERVRETLRRFRAYYAAHETDQTRPFPGIAPMVERLAADGVRMAVYSNKDDTFTQTLSARFFPGAFALVQGKVEGIPPKPDPAGIRRILANMAADLFVGDSPTDVHTGHNACVRVCAVTWGYRPRAALEQAGADCLADTAAALETRIRGGPDGISGGM